MNITNRVEKCIAFSKMALLSLLLFIIFTAKTLQVLSNYPVLYEGVVQKDVCIEELKNTIGSLLQKSIDTELEIEKILFKGAIINIYRCENLYEN